MSTVLELPAHDSPERPQDDEPRGESEVSSPSGVRVDRLADSVIALLVLAAVQRLVGFVRGVLVCRWLGRDELGQWDMAFGFLTLAAPLAVLGLPGSFGRYVGYFSRRGQLRVLVRRTGKACLILSAVAVAAIIAIRPQFSMLVFGSAAHTQLVVAMAIVLAVVIAFNYLTELLTALRMARATSVVQFFHSFLFAAFSIAFLWLWKPQATSLVAAYGLACVLLTGAMLWFLQRRWSDLTADQPRVLTDDEVDAERFWSRLLPFAAWVWVTNLLYNLFDVADRYMIVHMSPAADPLAIVGDYHSSRIVPLLLVSISALLSTVILPYLSHDWEHGRRDAVSARMNFALKLLGLMLVGGSLAILWIAPLLFEIAFEGKFAGGLEVLPWTLAYCCWFGLATMAQMYLWCAERARLGCVALGIGLVLNIVLNSLLLPRYGLPGAVIATSIANATVLALTYRFNAWLGMRFDPAVLVVSLLPPVLCLGILPATVALAVVAAVLVATNWLLNADEKQRLLVVWHDYTSRKLRPST